MRTSISIEFTKMFASFVVFFNGTVLIIPFVDISFFVFPSLSESTPTLNRRFWFRSTQIGEATWYFWCRNHHSGRRYYFCWHTQVLCNRFTQIKPHRRPRE